MSNHSIKFTILRSLATAKIALKNDLNFNVETKARVLDWLDFFRKAGIDTTEQLISHGKRAIKDEIHSIINESIAKLALALSSLISLVAGFLIISIGLIFAAIAFSLYIGEFLGNLALGFIISGALWITLILVVVKVFLNKRKIESYFLKHFKMT